MCESLAGVIKEFGRLYLGIDNCEPIGDVEKIEADLVAEQIKIRNNLTCEDNFNLEYNTESDDGPYINRKHFRNMLRSNKSITAHRGFVLSENEIDYKLYPPFKEFLRYFPGVHRIKDINMHLTGPKFDHMEEAWIFDDLYGLILDPLSSTADEWVQFFGEYGGMLLINLNPNSEHYGRIASIAIGYERNVMVTKYQFDDWLEIMVSNADRFISLWDTDEYNNFSIVSLLTFDRRIFDCDEYFKSRAKNIIARLDMIPLCLTEIIAAYITYSDLEKYDAKWFNKLDHDILLQYGMIDDLVRNMILKSKYGR